MVAWVAWQPGDPGQRGITDDETDEGPVEVDPYCAIVLEEALKANTAENFGSCDSGVEAWQEGAFEPVDAEDSLCALPWSVDGLSGQESVIDQDLTDIHQDEHVAEDFWAYPVETEMDSGLEDACGLEGYEDGSAMPQDEDELSDEGVFDARAVLVTEEVEDYHTFFAAFESHRPDEEGPRPPSQPPPPALLAAKGVNESSKVTSTAGTFAIRRALARLLPTETFETVVRNALKILEHTAHTTFGNQAIVRPFGSWVQGSHLQGSDLDLCIEGPGVITGFAAPGSNLPQVMALKRFRENLPFAFAVKETRFFRNIRVPILILEYHAPDGQTVEADISVGGADEKTGVEKGYIDRMIRSVLAQAPNAIPFIQLVKRWAKSEGLNKAYEGFLNSLGWTLLALYFLMCQGEVQPAAFIEPLAHSTVGIVPPRPLAMKAPAANQLVEFFEAVAAYGSWLKDVQPGSGPWGISLLTATEVQGPSGDRSPFYIEDPSVRLATNQSDNVARALTHTTWSHILQRCEAAVQALRPDGVVTEAAASAWAASLLDEGSTGFIAPVAKAQPAPAVLMAVPKFGAAASMGKLVVAGSTKRPAPTDVNWHNSTGSSIVPGTKRFHTTDGPGVPAAKSAVVPQEGNAVVRSSNRLYQPDGPTPPTDAPPPHLLRARISDGKGGVSAMHNGAARRG